MNLDTMPCVCSVVKASIDGGRSMIGQLPMTSCVRLMSTQMDSGILEISHIIMCSVRRFAITAILGGNSLNFGMLFNVRHSIPVHWSRHTGRVASVWHPRRSNFCSDDSDPNVSGNSHNLMKFDSAMVFNLSPRKREGNVRFPTNLHGVRRCARPTSRLAPKAHCMMGKTQ